MNGFAEDVDADVHIYLNGVGKSTNDLSKANEGGWTKKLEATIKTGDEGAKVTLFENYPSTRKIYAVGKNYSGLWGIMNQTSDILGYSGKDSLFTALDVLYVIKEFNLTQFDKVIIAGHSRGAAVGLTSFLFGIKKSVEGDDNFMVYQPVVHALFKSAKEINIVPMDPVSADYVYTNTYHMKDTWVVEEIYQFFNKQSKESQWGKSYIHEFYANSAAMLFSPSLDCTILNYFISIKFISKRNTSLNIKRYWIGFHHGAMISKSDDFVKCYPKANSPYEKMKQYLNTLLKNEASSIKESEWQKRIAKMDEDGIKKIKEAFFRGEITHSEFDYSLLHNHYVIRHSHHLTYPGHSTTVDMNAHVGHLGPSIPDIAGPHELMGHKKMVMKLFDLNTKAPIGWLGKNEKDWCIVKKNRKDAMRIRFFYHKGKMYIREWRRITGGNEFLAQSDKFTSNDENSSLGLYNKSSIGLEKNNWQSYWRYLADTGELKSGYGKGGSLNIASSDNDVIIYVGYEESRYEEERKEGILRYRRKLGIRFQVI